MLDRFADLVKKLTSTNGRLEKEAYLQEVANDADVLAVLKFLYNPYIVTGISDKKIAKFRDGDDLPLLAMMSGAGQSAAPTNFLDVLEYFETHNTGRDEDVKYLHKFAKSTNHRDLVYSVIKQDLKLGVQNTTLNKVFGEGFVPKFDVMLAENYADNGGYVQGKDYIITEKFDGVRCMVIQDPVPTFFSRQGQSIQGLVELAEQVKHLPPEFIYDGELLLDNPKKLKSEDLYRETVKVTNSDNEKRGLYFNVFDMIDKEAFKKGVDPMPCLARKARLEKLLGDMHAKGLCKNFKIVPMYYVGQDVTEISKWLDKFTRDGGEGIMLNISDAPYECKRTKTLLKVKQFNTADVLVVDVEEGTGANRGKLGAVMVKFIGPDGKNYTCKVGSGFKLEEREQFWADKSLIMGKIIEIGYFELSRNQNDENYSLRFPTFKHLRNDKKEISMH